MSAVLDETRKFVQNREPNYLSLQKDTLGQLVAFKDRIEFRDAIYRIYSRADKQAGAVSLKSTEKIAKKLIDLRKTDPHAKPSQVDDIIGMTVVVYYATQRDIVCKALEQVGTLSQIEVFGRDVKEKPGYYAVHFKVRSSKLMLKDLVGELQVKTLLHDGWAAKNHDLIYKPPFQLSPEIEAQAKIIGEQIQLVEKQSDIIRGLVERELAREKVRRKAAQERLMAVMTDPTDPNYDPNAAKLAQEIYDDIDHLRACSEIDPLLCQHFENWRSFRDACGPTPTRSVCRLITLLASAREAQDLTSIAVETINEWVDKSDKGETQASAIHFRALANYLFGSFEEAAENGREGVQYAKQYRLETQSPLANLCYFLAEYYFHQQHKWDEAHREQIRDELSKLTTELKAGDTSAPSIIDTLGAVAIATGKTPDEVREGWRQCRYALELITDKNSRIYPVRLAYYLLHERRACQRLLG